MQQPQQQVTPIKSEINSTDYSHASGELIGQSLIPLFGSLKTGITQYIIPEQSPLVSEYMCYKSLEELYKDIPNIKSCHWGQRKLLLTEILFLSLTIPIVSYPSQKIQVIYVGAAPCDHIYALCEMFPQCHFHLIDPAKWNADFVKIHPKLNRIKSRDETIDTYKISNSITVYHGYFKDNDALDFATRYKSDRVCFISDIRPIDTDTISNGDIIKREDIVTTDMELQKNWFTVIHDTNKHPDQVWCMLKFKPTYEIKLTTYLDGCIFLQPWKPLLSNECRLITNKTTTRSYDCSYFEGYLNYHNKFRRNQDHPSKHNKCNSMWDTQYEYDIIQLYVERVASKEWKQKFTVLDIMFWYSKQMGIRSSFNKECRKYTFQEGYFPPSFLKQKWVNKVLSLNKMYSE